MSEVLLFFRYLFVGALVTYLLRMLPLVFFKNKIRSRYIRSFLYYIPYAVLTAMTVPQIFYSTSYFVSALLGAVVAIILAYFRRGLIIVAAGASATVLICEMIISYLI